VLARTGAEVVCANPGEINSNDIFDSVDVLVLCHTVRQDRREYFSTTARKRWPGLRVLQLIKFEYESRSPEPHADAVAVFG